MKRDIRGPASPLVHVNISGRQLESGNLRADVDDALQRSGLDPGQLVLELTETHMPMLVDSMRKELLRMREIGVKVAIDDLGTGFSSLTRITELPVDILKIDVGFVARMQDDPSCAAVVRFSWSTAATPPRVTYSAGRCQRLISPCDCALPTLPRPGAEHVEPSSER
ncbi:MAG TPA: EAL domain-containing protein [Ilumatobacteraceae bacterium]|nr:EAL domain-containing protein [Ilumatobacteraceae bacterium]